MKILKSMGLLLGASVLTIAGGFYRVCLAEKALDANNGKNTYVHPSADQNNSNHLWQIKQIAADTFMIISQRNGGALDANNGTGNLYTHPNPDRKNSNHLWKFKKAGIYYIIISVQTNTALDANNGTGNLYLHPNPDPQNNNQRWRLQKVGDYRLIIPAVGDNLK